MPPVPPTAAAIASQRAQRTGRLLPLRETPDGWHILTIHWSAVPDYDYPAACKGMTPEAIRRELEIDWSATVGKRVYPQFSRATHVALEPLPFDPALPLYCGWDFGGTPAFVPTQRWHTGQWFVYPPLVPPEEQTWGIYEFGREVADHLAAKYALPHGKTLNQLKLVHIGDPAGNAPPPRTADSPKEMRTCFQILDKGVELVTGYDQRNRPIIERKPGWGWRVMPGAVNITDRLESIRARLTTNLREGVPAIIVCPNATTIIEGFLGGYHYKQRVDGRYELDPFKNWYSHPMDALGYIATRLFALPKGRYSDDDDDDGRRHTSFQSQAARRGRNRRN